MKKLSHLYKNRILQKHKLSAAMGFGIGINTSSVHGVFDPSVKIPWKANAGQQSINDLALNGLHKQPLQRLHQRALHRAADAAGVEQHHLLIHLLHQMVIQPHRAELVDQHGALAKLRLLDPVVEQGGLAAAEKTGQQGHGDAGVLHVCHRVAPPLIGRRMSKRVSCISVMSDPYRLANRSPSQRFSKRPWGSSSRFRARKSCQRGNRAGKS